MAGKNSKETRRNSKDTKPETEQDLICMVLSNKNRIALVHSSKRLISPNLNPTGLYL